MDLSDVITQLKCWEARAKKHAQRVLMAGEDSETSRHREEELRQCIKEIKMLFEIKDPEPIKEPAAPAKAESSSGAAPVPITTTLGKPTSGPAAVPGHQVTTALAP